MKTKIQFLKRNMSITASVILLIAVGLSSCKKDDADDNNNQAPAMINYSGSFVKSTADVVTSASGTTTATFNPTTLELSYTLTWTGLGTNAISMHIHDNGPVIVPISGFSKTMAGTVSGKATLTADQAKDLEAGKLYSQIHSENYPGGEIIATLLKDANQPNPSSNSAGNTNGY